MLARAPAGAYLADMRYLLACLPVLLLVACGDRPAAPAPADKEKTLRVSPVDGADPQAPVARVATPRGSGVDVPSDAVALRQVAPPAAPAKGLSSPEVGVGEYASEGWVLPSDGGASANEGPPPEAEAPLVPRTRAQELAQEARVVEDLPPPTEPEIRIVEDLPPVE